MKDLEFENFNKSLNLGQIYKMNKQLSESETLYKLVRLFIVQYLANVRNILTQLDNYKSVQNQAINMLATHVIKLMKKLIVQIKRILLLQGRVEPNCLHLLVAVKQINLFDLDKFLSFIIDKRYEKFYQIQVTNITKNQDQRHIIFQTYSLTVFTIQILEIISKVFQNDIELINRYEKEKDLPTIKFIKNPYLFKFQDQNQCLPFKCGIDEAFTKPAQFTYKSTVDKIQKQKKNIQNLVAFTRRQNRKALGLYLDSQKQNLKSRKKTKQNQEEEEQSIKQIESQSQSTKQFDFIRYL